MRRIRYYNKARMYALTLVHVALKKTQLGFCVTKKFSPELGEAVS